MKNLFTLLLVLVFTLSVKAQCNLTNFTSAYNIKATDFLILV